MRENSTDIAPIPASARNAGPLTMFWLYAGGNVLLATFIVGSTYAEGLGLRTTVAVTVVGNLAAYAICAVATQKNVKHGLDEAISHRPAFGYHGALFGVFLIVFITVGWVGILSNMTGTAGRMVMATMADGLTVPGDYSVYALGGGILVPLLLLLIEPRISFRLANVTVPLMILFSVYMLVEMVRGDHRASLAGVEATGDVGWMYAFEMILAFAVVWLPYIGAWNKFATTERSGFWGTYLGLAVVGALFGVIGGLATLLTGEMDPTMWMRELDLGISGFVIVILGTVTSSAILLYAAVMAILTVAPNWSFRLTAIGTAAPAVIFVYEGTLRGIFDLILIFGGMLAGPYWAVILVDYFFVRKQTLNVADCYNPRGCYRYRGGVHIKAVLAQVLGMAVWIYLGGWMTGFEVLTLPAGDTLFDFTTATLPAMAVAAGAYYALVAVFPTGQRPTGSDTRHTDTPSVQTRVT